MTDPRFIITTLLIVLFGYAYLQDPSDQAMKGALIAAFAAAYGHWLGSKQNEKATENTGKAFSAIEAAAKAGSTHDTVAPQQVEVVNTAAEPVPTTEASEELPDYARP